MYSDRITKTREGGKAAGFLVLFFCLLAALFFLPTAVKADDSLTPVYPDVTDSATDWTYYGIAGSYITQAQEALDRINEIRLEACTEGMPDPRDSNRNLTTSDYVPIKWSSDLERIARIRAAESSLTMGHSRLNQGYVFNVYSNGLRGTGEVLAWNWSDTMADGVEQWYGEKEDWVNQNADSVTGHYTAMINPDNTYVGLGTFCTEEAYYYNTTAGQFSQSRAKLDGTMLPARQNIMQYLEVSNSYITELVLENTEEVAEGEVVQVKAKAALSGGKTMYPDGTITYQSSDPSVAGITQDGTLKANKVGTTQITVYLNGNLYFVQQLEIACDHTFEVQGDDGEGHSIVQCTKCGATKSLVLPTSFRPYFRNSMSESEYYYSVIPSSNPVGSEINIWIYSINGGEGANRILLESSDPSVLKVPKRIDADKSAHTVANALNPGIVTLTMKLEYNPAVSKSYQVVVGENGDLDISDCEITLSGDSFIHTKRAITPSVEVRYHGLVLQQNTYYSVRYSDNTEVGTGKVIVTGKGLFAGSEYTAEFDIRHNLEEIAAAEPACTKAGNSAYYKCSVCSRYFADAEGKDEIALDETVVPAKGHQPKEAVKENEKTPTCTQKGFYQSVVYCADCGEELSRTNVVVDEIPHTQEPLTATAPSCTESGLTEGSKCSVCGKILQAQEVIPALGHDYKAEVKKPTCTEKGFTVYTCSRCGDSYTAEYTDEIPHTPETVTGYEATCTEDGLTEGSKCSVCGKILEAQKRIRATGHEMGPWIVETEATMDEDGLEYRICTHGCGFREARVIPAGTHEHRMEWVEKEAETCFEDGHTGYWLCTFCHNMYADQQGEEILSEDDIVLPKHHVPEVIPAVEATCLSEGLTEGSKCSVCGQILTEQDVVEKTGHDYQAVITKPTCTEKGYTTYTCRFCKDSYTDDLTEAVGHSYQIKKWRWSGTESATAELVCEHDSSHVRMEQAEITETITKQPKAGKDGSKVFTATVVFDGRTYRDQITKKVPYVYPDSIKLDRNSLELAVGQTNGLIVTVEPAGVSEPGITWTSSDPKVAAVDANGNVTALTRGRAVITATSAADSHKKASCAVTVLFKDATHANVSNEMFEAVYWAADNKITGEKQVFGTFNSMTRGQFVRFLYRYADQPKVTSSMIRKYGSKFKDVDKNYSHYKAIVWAVSKGLIGGYNDGTFKPNGTLTRNNVATILWKYAGSPKVKNIKKPFSDVKRSNAIAWGKNRKIFTGSKFNPKANCLRGDFAVFLHRYDRVIGDGSN